MLGGIGLCSWFGTGREDRRVTFLPPSFLFFLFFPQRLLAYPLLWAMAFYSYVIAFPNSCRAKSHGLHRGGTPPSRHLYKPHGLLIPF